MRRIAEPPRDHLVASVPQAIHEDLLMRQQLCLEAGELRPVRIQRHAEDADASAACAAARVVLRAELC
jgi:hypothetical protein